MFARRSTTARRLALSAVLSAVGLGACQTGFLLPAIPGALRINFSSYPGDMAPFYWTVSVDGAVPRGIGGDESGTLWFDDVRVGDHTIIVRGVPPTCTGPTSQTVVVKSRDTTEVTLDLKCPPRTTGDLSITVRTNGIGVDPDGYLVTVDDRPGLIVPSTTSHTILMPKVQPGSRPVVLSRLAPQCVVTEDSPRSAFIVVDSTTRITIDVVCFPTPLAFIRVLTSTIGTGLVDPNGYLATIGVDRDLPIGIGGTLFYVVRPGTYEVTLGDIEPSCFAATTTRTVTVAAGDTAVAGFAVTCGDYPATTAGVIAADATNDTLPNLYRHPSRAIDVVSLSARHAPGLTVLTIKTRLPIDNATLSGTIEMDLDENLATGRVPVVSYHGGTAAQGVDASIVVNKSSFGISAMLIGPTIAAALRTVAAGDSIQIYLPPYRLRDDGRMTITALFGTGDRATDIAPNAGVITVRAPALAAQRQP